MIRTVSTVLRIAFESHGWAEYLAWRDEPAMWKKVNRLIEATARDPFAGIGSPKPLEGKLAGTWSRRISRVDRLVYFVDDDTLVIVKCRHHY